jgi:hypothetical protein
MLNNLISTIRFIFPLLFAVFNLAYWLYYLLAKGSNEDFKDNVK